MSEHSLSLAIGIDLGVVKTLMSIKGNFVHAIKQQNRHQPSNAQIFDDDIKRLPISFGIKN